MLRKFAAAIHRGLFWTYERGTWQYDIMVVLILGFIFLTPRAWFQDKPAGTAISDVAPCEISVTAQKCYRLRAGLIESETAEAPQAPDGPDALKHEAARVLKTYTGKAVEILRVEPAVRNPQGQVVSYAVWVQE